MGTFRFEFVYLYFFWAHYFNFGLKSDFLNIMPQFNWKYILTAFIPMLLIIKLTTQPIFFKLLVFIALQNTFHAIFIYCIKYDKWSLRSCLCNGFSTRNMLPENSHFIISPSLAYLVFWIQTLLFLFQMGWDVFVIIFSINPSKQKLE